jgi:hypothetical protein
MSVSSPRRGEVDVLLTVLLVVDAVLLQVDPVQAGSARRVDGRRSARRLLVADAVLLVVLRDVWDVNGAVDRRESGRVRLD